MNSPQMVDLDDSKPEASWKVSDVQDIQPSWIFALQTLAISP
jgi:hypothetical protein